MTDYLYSLSLARQTQGFLLSLGLGFILGLCYDLVRVVRVSLSGGKRAVAVFDILYCLFAGLCIFLFCLGVNEGELRFYLVGGTALGFGIYYFSLGAVIYPFLQRKILSLRALIGKFFRFIFKPFRVLFVKIKEKTAKTVKKSKKNTKKVKNKSNFLLKINKVMLYNLFDSSFKTRSGKNTDNEEV